MSRSFRPESLLLTSTTQCCLIRPSSFGPGTNFFAPGSWCHVCKDAFLTTAMLWRPCVTALLIEYSETFLPMEKSHIPVYTETSLFPKFKKILSNLNEHLSSHWKQKCLSASKQAQYLPNRSFNLQMLENEWRSKAFLQTTFPPGDIWAC